MVRKDISKRVREHTCKTGGGSIEEGGGEGGQSGGCRRSLQHRSAESTRAELLHRPQPQDSHCSSETNLTQQPGEKTAISYDHKRRRGGEDQEKYKRRRENNWTCFPASGWRNRTSWASMTSCSTSRVRFHDSSFAWLLDSHNFLFLSLTFRSRSLGNSVSAVITHKPSLDLKLFHCLGLCMTDVPEWPMNEWTGVTLWRNICLGDYTSACF